MITTRVLADYMIPTNQGIPAGTLLLDAIKQMKLHHLQYLPVQRGNDVVGVLNSRNAAAAVLSKWASEFTVDDLMISRPAVVAPNTSLYEVLGEMPHHKGGYTVIQDNTGKLSGVLTSLEAAIAFHDLSIDAHSVGCIFPCV